MGLFSRTNKGKLVSGAHIKPSTAGTSNEVSFSVLHAAKHEMDVRHGEAKLDDELGKIKLYSGEQEVGYDIVGSTDAVNLPASESVSPQDDASQRADGQRQAASRASNGRASDPEVSFEQEVKSRKEVRKKRKAAAKTITAVAVVALMAVVVVGVYGYMQRATSFKELMNETLVQVFQTDNTIVLLNEILADPTSDDSKANADKALEQILSAQTSLNAANPKLGKLQDEAMWADEQEVVSWLVQSTNGRIAMLESGRDLVEKLKAANETIASIEEAWGKVSDADSEARGAADLVESPTEANLAAARSKLDSAISLVNLASESVRTIQAKDPSLDLSAQTTYMEAQKTVYSEQEQAIDSVLAEDSASARAHQSAASEAEKKARALAEKVEYVGQPVVDNYKNVATSLIEEYEEARNEVAVADEYLRKYYEQ